MNEKTNALEELAERLNTDLNVVRVISVEFGSEKGSACWHLLKDIRKASRIVAELAKVKVCKDADKFMPLDKPYDGVTVYADNESDYGGNDFNDKDSDCILDLANAAWNCRAIAEEGANNG